MAVKKHIFNFAKLALFLVIFVLLIIVITSVIGPSRLSSIQSTVDATWWQVSIIRWTLLAIISLVVFPRWSKNRMNRAVSLHSSIKSEMKQAEIENANHETLEHYRKRLLNVSSQVEFFSSMYRNRVYVCLMMFMIELLLVQLPHHL